MGFLQAISPIIEIIIIAVIINYLLSFFWNTRSMDLMLGLVAFLLIFAVSSWLPFVVLHKLMLLGANVAAIAIIVIFQPELRIALSKLSLKGKRYREITEFDKFLDQLATSTYNLAKTQTGALIVLEKDDSLEEFTKNAVQLNSDFSSELLESIFCRYAPLHDGAVVIKDTKIIAASVILPLADSMLVPKNLGTRHRAAVGLSVATDAVIIVVSEETAKVSIVREGVFTRGVKIDRFKGVIRSLFCKDQEKQSYNKSFNFREWLKK